MCNIGPEWFTNEEYAILREILHLKIPKIENNFRSRGKESTEVRITQNKGKESKNSYQNLKRSP